jgi:hypothetical protein
MAAQTELGLDFTPELIAAENSVARACLTRLRPVRQSDFQVEEDGTLSRAVTLWSPTTLRLRRVKERGLVVVSVSDDPRAETALMKKGDTSEGLTVVGFQLDKLGQFQGYIPALRLPRTISERTRIGTLNRRDPFKLIDELRVAAREIWTSKKVDPTQFDRLYGENPYVGAKI